MGRKRSKKPTAPSVDWLALPPELMTHVAQSVPIMVPVVMRGTCRAWADIANALDTDGRPWFPKPTLHMLKTPPPAYYIKEISGRLKRFNYAPLVFDRLTSGKESAEDLLLDRADGRVCEQFTWRELRRRDTYMIYRHEAGWFVGGMHATQDNLCLLLALSPERFKDLGVRRTNRQTRYHLYNVEEALRSALHCAGGIWGLFARQYSRAEGRRLAPVKIQRTPTHQAAVDAITNLLKDSHTPLGQLDAAHRMRILKAVRVLPTV